MLRESRCNNDTIDCSPPRLGILTTTIVRRGPPLARARSDRGSSQSPSVRVRVARRFAVFAPAFPPRRQKLHPRHANKYDRVSWRRAVLRGQGAQGRPDVGLRVGHRFAQVPGGEADAVAVELGVRIRLK